MIAPHRDCFTTSVTEKLQWFKDATWSGERPPRTLFVSGTVLYCGGGEERAGYGRAYRPALCL